MKDGINIIDLICSVLSWLETLAITRFLAFSPCTDLDYIPLISDINFRLLFLGDSLSIITFRLLFPCVIFFGLQLYIKKEVPVIFLTRTMFFLEFKLFFLPFFSIFHIFFIFIIRQKACPYLTGPESGRPMALLIRICMYFGCSSLSFHRMPSTLVRMQSINVFAAAIIFSI